ncbi:tyrosine-type recombinase/integrase [Bradyrhizobium sp. CCBAU 51753]|uniref:tyrosine-type recombinase/integrase n=1 Tax=Bradyrhizobium sp. CCBAU 51753 TaxID=1325100 RepID=UPI00352FF689
MADTSGSGSLDLAMLALSRKQTIDTGSSIGDPVRTDRRPLRHVARFILIGLYPGTRAGAIAAASPYRELGHSYVDLERGIFYRRPIGKRATKKRQTPAPLPPRLLAHMRRWKDRKLISTCFVEFNGKPVASVKKGFKSAVDLAKLSGKVIPHTLRHTAATWLMQHGVPIWEAAGFLGMSPEVLQDTYGHHHPDHCTGRQQPLATKRDMFRWSNRWLTREQPPMRTKNVRKSGRSGRIRTCDPCVPNAVSIF